MKRKVLIQTVILFLLVGGSVAFGWWLGRDVTFAAGGNDASHSVSSTRDVHAADDESTDQHAEEEHIHLSEEAYMNLELRLGKITLEDYTRTIRIPGKVVEIPGKSSRSIAAPVAGIVDRVFVDAGQVVPGEAPLLELKITDEELISGQVALLDVESRLEVAQSELDRLSPLAESGTIAGRRRLELQYETQQLRAQLEARVQELDLRGLTPPQIAGIRKNRKLVHRVLVRLPHVASGTEPTPESEIEHLDQAATVRTASASGTDLTEGTPERTPFTVQLLSIHPGMSVARGDELCRLADHRWLYIRGEAFEEDIASIARLRERGWSVTAEFGHQHVKEHQHLRRVENLCVFYVDDHVDAQTRTFRFYLGFRNEPAQEYRDENGVLFRQWEYKPGQIAHLIVPVEQWQGQIVLPLAALVEEGPSVFVFRRHEELLLGEKVAKDDHHEHEDRPFIEFEPVEVRLLHKDAQRAVLSGGGLLKIGDEVALNRAYQLGLAMKMASGEGGHHHHHDH